MFLRSRINFIDTCALGIQAGPSFEKRQDANTDSHRRLDLCRTPAGRAPVPRASGSGAVRFNKCRESSGEVQSWSIGRIAEVRNDSLQTGEAANKKGSNTGSAGWVRDLCRRAARDGSGKWRLADVTEIPV